MIDKYEKFMGREGTVRFPAGLEQPPGRFRFSMDALLLAAFGSQCCRLPRLPRRDDSVQAGRISGKGGGVFVDLGTGCGVVGLTFLLMHTEASLRGIGIEQDGELVAAANRNAYRLDLQERFSVVHGMVEKIVLTVGPADLVLANPPWRVRGTGRGPTSPWREQALFGEPETLACFAAAGARLLRPHGIFAGVVATARLPDQFEALRTARLGLRRLRFVHARFGQPASMVLFEARAQTKDDLCVDSPLFLFDHFGNVLGDALEFCPFLCASRGGL